MAPTRPAKRRVRASCLEAVVLIYLPIAELPVNMFIIFGMGAAVGFLSGLFGVGGGFLLTPLLIFSGIPPAVAVATVTSAGRRLVDYGRALLLAAQADRREARRVLLVAGLIGTLIGVWFFNRCAGRPARPDHLALLRHVSRRIGAPDARESVRAILNARRGGPRRCAGPAMPGSTACRSRCASSAPKLYVSVIPIVALGIVIGFARHAPRHRRRLHPGAGADLSLPRADQCRRRHLAVPDRRHHVGGDRAAFRAPTSRSTWCWRCILMVGGVIGAQFGAAPAPISAATIFASSSP